MRILRLLVAVIAVLGLGGAGYWYFLTQKAASLPAGFASGNGRIEADQIDISTRIPGRVAEILVREGDMVAQGQRLAVMDTRELAAEIARAEADVAGADANAEQARAVIEQGKADLTFAKQEYDRAKSLADRGVSSRQTVEQKFAQLTSAQAKANADVAALRAAERSADASRALVAQYQTQMDDAVLTSPVLGRVLYRISQPGEVLAGGGKVLTLLDLSQVYMEVFLPANQATQTSIGAEARIRLDAIPYAIPAFVSFVSPEAQFTPKQVETQDEREKLMFRVKVRVPQELVVANIDRVKTGIRGLAFIRLAGQENASWPVEAGPEIPATAAQPVK